MILCVRPTGSLLGIAFGPAAGEQLEAPPFRMLHVSQDMQQLEAPPFRMLHVSQDMSNELMGSCCGSAFKVELGNIRPLFRYTTLITSPDQRQ